MSGQENGRGAGSTDSGNAGRASGAAGFLVVASPAAGNIGLCQKAAFCGVTLPVRKTCFLIPTRASCDFGNPPPPTSPATWCRYEVPGRLDDREFIMSKEKQENDHRATLAISDGDLLAPPSMMRAWAAHLKNYEFATVPESGDSIAWEQPE